MRVICTIGKKGKVDGFIFWEDKSLNQVSGPIPKVSVYAE